MISLPIVWILGFTTAHRFNQTRSRAIPFIANAVPMMALLWFSLILARDEGREFIWMVAYTGSLLTLLGTGMIAALLSTPQNPQTPNKTSLLTPDPLRVESDGDDSTSTLKSESALGQA
jgi:hypothetical protein